MVFLEGEIDLRSYAMLLQIDASIHHNITNHDVDASNCVVTVSERSGIIALKENRTSYSLRYMSTYTRMTTLSL